MPIDRIRQLMRMEVSAPSGEAIVRMLNWLLEGLGLVLPRGLRQTGWRPKHRLIRLSPDLITEKVHVIETARFGDRRLDAGEATLSLPLHIALHRNSYYITRLSLPPEATGSFTNAVALRLPDLSPIPPGDAVYSVGGVSLDGEGRASAAIAITKKKTLEEVAARYANDNINVIGAEPNKDGVLQFTFSRERSGPAAMTKQRLARIALFAISVLFLIVAVDVHQQRRLEAHRDYESEVLSALRAMRPAASLFDGVDAATLQSVAGQSIQHALYDVDAALALLPAGAVVTRLHASGDGLVVEGFSPSVSASGREGPNGANPRLSTTPSDHPGFDRFTMNVRSGEAP